MLGNNASYEDSFTACQITPENHGSLLDSPLNMQLASRNPLSGQIAADYSFFARFTDPLPSTSSTCTLTFARSFARLSQNFRENIRIHRPLTPAISRGRIEGKASTRGLGVWLSQSLTFGNLAAAFGACFLRLQEASLGSDSGRCKDTLQDHAWCLAVAKPHLWKLGCYRQGAEPEPNRNSPVPFSCRTPGGSGRQAFT